MHLSRTRRAIVFSSTDNVFPQGLADNVAVAVAIAIARPSFSFSFPSSSPSSSLSLFAEGWCSVHVCRWWPGIPHVEQCFLFLPSFFALVVVVGLLVHLFLEWPLLLQMLQWYGRGRWRFVFCGGMS
jgi:hypothetical protein